jgi:TRAP-type C4-dicarboxylate transport system permease small subunit
VTRNILLYALVGLIMGGGSIYLSFGPLTSDTWLWRYGLVHLSLGEPGTDFIVMGALKDALRLITLIVLFVLAQAWLFSKVSEKYWSGSPHPLSFYRNLMPQVRRRTLVLIGMCLIVAVIYHVYLGPHDMHQVWQKRMGATALNFREHFLPYLASMFYTLTLYFMVAIPLLIVIWESLQSDRARVWSATNQIGKGYAGRDGDPLSLKRSAGTVENRFIGVRNDLRGIIDRYVLMALMVVAYLSYELYSLNVALACPAQHIQKWAAWVFIFYVLPYFLYRGIQTYRRAYNRSVEILQSLARSAEGQGGGDALLAISDIQSKFQEKYTLSSFFWSLRKSGSVGVVLFAAFVGLIFKYTNFLEFNRRAIPWPASAVVLVVHNISARGPADRDQRNSHPLAPECEESLPEDHEWEQFKANRDR